MNRPLLLNRREFAGVAAKAVLGSVALGASSRTASEAPPPVAASGIWKINRYPKAFESPADVPEGEIRRYALSSPFQVAPRVAGTYLNFKICCGPGQDFEGGSDIVLFDRLGELRANSPLKVARNYLEPNPNLDGKICQMVAYPGNVGFVPLGAKLPDNRPHPHAGTGFVLTDPLAWPTDRSNGYLTDLDRIGIAAYVGKKRYRVLELYQLTYDGAKFTVDRREVIQAADLAPGFRFEAAGMGCAIADGNDLICGIKMTKSGDSAASAGLMRWRRVDGAWRPAGYEMITPADDSLEPSVIRDLDGSLLVCARGPRSMGPPLRIWRQSAAGEPWKLVINLDRLVPSTPIALYRAVDGTPFVATNVFQPPSRPDRKMIETAGSRGPRSTLCIWTVNEKRDGLDAQLIARDPRVEFGVPPHGTVWALDHPMASPVRLADEQWHCLMGYRLLEWKENTHYIPPSPQTGSYLDEVVSCGPPAPLWNF
jgi:hypothetical protein